jgi:tRNA-dihydrouridine synthase B
VNGAVEAAGISESRLHVGLPQFDKSLAALLPAHRPLLVLAPMQDITDLAFWRVIAAYGPPDLLVTEYFRVHPDSRPEKRILRAIRENPCGCPVLAQMIGRDVPGLVRTAAQLERENVLGIDLNLGCPAPVVCRKESGGGLLRQPEHIDAILRALRETVGSNLTVKTRVGFMSTQEFEGVLAVLGRHQLDGVTVHARTVGEMYGPVGHYHLVRRAVAALDCPVIANGNVSSVPTARAVALATGAHGLMIGRGAVRNPWIFRQIRDAWEGRAPAQPSLRDVRAYVDALYRAVCDADAPERCRVARIKKHLNFILPGLHPDEALLRRVRTAGRERELFAACDDLLDRDGEFPHDPDPRSPCAPLLASIARDAVPGSQPTP